MAIVAALFASLFGHLLGSRKGAVAAVLGISVYMILVGANAAVVRAAIIGGVSLHPGDLAQSLPTVEVRRYSFRLSQSLAKTIANPYRASGQ
jgi:hypothetical protein